MRRVGRSSGGAVVVNHGEFTAVRLTINTENLIGIGQAKDFILIDSPMSIRTFGASCLTDLLVVE